MFLIGPLLQEGKLLERGDCQLKTVCLYAELCDSWITRLSLARQPLPKKTLHYREAQILWCAAGSVCHRQEQFCGQPGADKELSFANSVFTWIGQVSILSHISFPEGS